MSDTAKLAQSVLASAPKLVVGFFPSTIPDTGDLQVGYGRPCDNQDGGWARFSNEAFKGGIAIELLHPIAINPNKSLIYGIGVRRTFDR